MKIKSNAREARLSRPQSSDWGPDGRSVALRFEGSSRRDPKGLPPPMASLLAQGLLTP